MTLSQPRPFIFQTDFGSEPGLPAPAPHARRKRVYLAEEVDEIRAAALREGEAGVVARAEVERAQAIAALADAARAGLSSLDQAVVTHKASAAELVLRCAEIIAGGALARFPAAPLEAALEALAQEFEGQARLVVRVPDPESRTHDVAVAADAAGIAGKVALKPLPGPEAAFEIVWGDGEARFDPDAAALRIREAFDAALAAEGFTPAQHSPTEA